MITPVLLCGGSGTRLWPVSRRSYPKQFARLAGGESLLGATARRLVGADFAPPLVLTAADFRFIVADELAEAGVVPGAILLEPAARNTGPSVLAAALHLAARDPDALMLVAPSDHLLPDADGFQAALLQGLDAARAGQIVTFGIMPTRAETGYGWIEAAGPGIAPVRRFVEKPAAARAAEMLASGRFLWNAGIFLGRAANLVAAFTEHAGDLVAGTRAALDGATPDLGFLRLAAAPWDGLRNVSVDYAVMERATNLTVVPYGGEWSDLGDWEAVWRAAERDGEGVARIGRVTALDCSASLLRSEAGGPELVGIGLSDIIAVAMGDAVLVAHRSRAQEVRAVVSILREKGAASAEEFPRAHRPWGWYEVLVSGKGFSVKRITVRPGGVLSLQSHRHRAEHWVVVSGRAQVTIGAQVQDLGANQSIYVPQGERHRLANMGSEAMVLIEVQTGSYLGEDDITRYEDIYARG